ncbi:MAG: hypothetical protein NVS1B4_22240 [Gemmatimonadaceae bacterium]
MQQVIAASVSTPDVTRRDARRGFTLIEIMVAVLILAVGVLGLVSTSGFVMRQVGDAAFHTRAAAIATSRMERLRAVNCKTLGTGGTTTSRGIVDTYTIADSGKKKFVTDSLVYTLRGSVVRQIHRTMIYCP